MITFNDYKSILRHQEEIRKQIRDFENGFLEKAAKAYGAENPKEKPPVPSAFALWLFQPWKRQHASPEHRGFFVWDNRMLSIVAETDEFVIALNPFGCDKAEPPYVVLLKEQEE